MYKYGVSLDNKMVSDGKTVNDDDLLLHISGEFKDVNKNTKTLNQLGIVVKEDFTNLYDRNDVVLLEAEKKENLIDFNDKIAKKVSVDEGLTLNTFEFNMSAQPKVDKDRLIGISELPVLLTIENYDPNVTYYVKTDSGEYTIDSNGILTLELKTTFNNYLGYIEIYALESGKLLSIPTKLEVFIYRLDYKYTDATPLINVDYSDNSYYNDGFEI